MVQGGDRYATDKGQKQINASGNKERIRPFLPGSMKRDIAPHTPSSWFWVLYLFQYIWLILELSKLSSSKQEIHQKMHFLQYWQYFQIWREWFGWLFSGKKNNIGTNAPFTKQLEEEELPSAFSILSTWLGHSPGEVRAGTWTQICYTPAGHPNYQTIDSFLLSFSCPMTT